MTKHDDKIQNRKDSEQLSSVEPGVSNPLFSVPGELHVGVASTVLILNYLVNRALENGPVSTNILTILKLNETAVDIQAIVVSGENSDVVQLSSVDHRHNFSNDRGIIQGESSGRTVNTH